MQIYVKQPGPNNLRIDQSPLRLDEYQAKMAMIP
jgi:hypothetical protein